MKNQHLAADDHTVVYLVNLLIYFNDPDNLPPFALVAATVTNVVSW